MRRGHRFSIPSACILERKVGDSGRGLLGDNFQTLCDTCSDGLFQAGVETLRIFPDKDDVHFPEAALNTGNIDDRTQAGVEFQFLSQFYVGTGKACGHSSGQGAFQGHFVLSNRLRNSIGKGCAVFGDSLQAGFHLLPLQVGPGPGRVQKLNRGSGHLRTDSVSRNESNPLGH